MQPRKHELFTQHSRNWRDNRYVYPVVSRRSKGVSIGVNLNPDKACNFDCVYCCVDRSVDPSVRDVSMPVLVAELDDMIERVSSGAIFAEPPFDKTPEALRRLNDVAFSGDGEPTSFRGFPEACEVVAGLLLRHGRPDVKIVVITNATLLHRPAIQQALRYLDSHHGEIWAKLDAGSEDYYRAVERTSVPFQRVLDNIRNTGRHRPIVIQSLFLQMNGIGPDDAEIDAYIGRLRSLMGAGCGIKLVQVYTVARTTAEAFVTPLPDARLDAIAARVRMLGLPVESFYGPG